MLILLSSSSDSDLVLFVLWFSSVFLCKSIHVHICQYPCIFFPMQYNMYLLSKSMLCDVNVLYYLLKSHWQ